MDGAEERAVADVEAGLRVRGGGGDFRFGDRGRAEKRGCALGCVAGCGGPVGLLHPARDGFDGEFEGVWAPRSRGVSPRGGWRGGDVPAPWGFIAAENEGLIPVVRVGEVVFQKPALDRCRRGFAGLGFLCWSRFRGGDDGGEVGDGLVIEEMLGREREAGFAGLGDDEDRKDRVAAEFKEVVVHADAFEAEDALPDGCERAFGGRARGEETGGEIGACGLGCGEGAVVEFAVAGEREAVERDKRRGQHVVGQARLEMRAEFVGGRHFAARDEVGDEALFAAGLGAGDDGGLADGGMLREERFDFAQLDAEAANLYLLVDAAEIFDVAARQPAGEVAGAVEAFAFRKGAGDEALGGEFRAVEVAAGDAFAADEQLAGNADGHWAERGVEDVDAEVGNGNADDAAGLYVAGAERAVGDVDGRLGDAVHVDELRLGVAMAVEPRLETLHLQRLAAEDDEAEGGRL